MAMPTITQVRSGLVVRLRTISGLHVFDVWPAVLRDFPAAVVTVTGESPATMGGYTLRGRVVVLSAPAAQDYAAGQTLLDPYLEPTGTSSVTAAIEGDIDLGGLECTVNVTGWDNYSARWEAADLECFGAAVNFEVYR